VVFVAAGGAPRCWAVPIVTDIAFTLAVLAVISSHLPGAMRTFLLTPAVVDDLLAILVIAIFYASALHLLPLLGAALDVPALDMPALDMPAFSVAAFDVAALDVLVQCGRAYWWPLLPRAEATWVFTHASGVHATVAGVALAFTVPVDGPGGITLAERFEHTWHPISAGFAMPVFAFLASGVTLGGSAGAITVAVAVALVIGNRSASPPPRGWSSVSPGPASPTA
jgi:NhaA family Na+:H+ antiporter